MDTRITTPSRETMCAAIEMASRAPSLGNSQPWRWLLGDHAVHLYIDRSRMLPVPDPTGRELVISCGAVLHHACIAFAVCGWPATVRVLPHPANPDHLASLEFTRPSEVDSESEVVGEAAELAAAMADRRTDRRPFRPGPVPDELLTVLAEAARGQSAWLVPVLDVPSRGELVDAIQYAGSVRRESPELAQWAEGGSAESRRTARGRDFALSAGNEPPMPVLDDGAVLAVLATSGDSYESWLHAGAALSAVLLEATRRGLATCTLSQIGEVAASRVGVRRDLLGDAGQPQLALRIGWPVTRQVPGPRSPRRPVSESIETEGARHPR